MVVRVGIIVSRESTYGAFMHQGIRRYGREGRRWVFRYQNALGPGRLALLDWGAQGLICMLGGVAQAQRYREMGVPVVNVSNRISDTLLPSVHVDDVAVGRAAAEHLLGLGLRRFAVVGQLDCRFSDQRLAGFAEVLGQRGLSAEAFNRATIPPGAGPGDLDRIFGDWLTSLPKPVGLFTAEDIAGERFLDVCVQLGLQVPEQVAVVGANDLEAICEGTWPPMSSVSVPFERIGYEAAKLLDTLMRGGEPPTRPVVLPPGPVTARQSTNILAIDDPQVAAAVRFINDHLDEPITLGDVLAHVPLARRTLEQRFRRLLGLTPYQQIEHARIERATRLLIETDLPTSRIAAACGFANASRLGITCRKLTGLTPTAYRNQFRQR